MKVVVANLGLSKTDATKIVSPNLDNVQCCGKSPSGTVLKLAQGSLSISGRHRLATLVEYEYENGVAAIRNWSGRAS